MLAEQNQITNSDVSIKAAAVLMCLGYWNYSQIVVQSGLR
jgi:hypothetical protein